MRCYIIIKGLLAASLLLSCERFEPYTPLEEDLLDGPVEGLTSAERAQFLLGDSAFNDDVFTSEMGLGPVFVANSCVGCHAGDGKGTPFTTLTRFGQSDARGNQFLHLGGPQLQNRALPGYEPETIPDGATFSKFTPPAVTGLGFLQYVSDADIIRMSDPDDADGDGISGVPNWIPLRGYLQPSPNAIENNGKYIHRFGKKAAAYDLLHQSVLAYNQDMGITSIFEPRDVFSGLEIDPEVSTQTVNNIVFYLKTLKAPLRRNKQERSVIKGERIFSKINCASCHVPELSTGRAPIEALSYKTFYPYTDLLLHDMGPGLDDGYTEGTALTSEWRTPPLWGLGLSPTTQGGTYFLMHDGRARSIEEAILLHGGEAEDSKLKYKALTHIEKKDLIKFLESL
ncbi:di-heme oxidoredictase family protein [Tenacibaculum maritimum]|uniref:di-heme oxidoredictase family protein n=1 Tax=Tenacibaculum maritimum TaxID=107401 RepID=UPI001E5B7F06|nr:di-heme oxidoredictase family protein [Tenacibaculum maritimum]MCD9610814.1 thiol oxidoreductase [Tenacibaculum maritimum]